MFGQVLTALITPFDKDKKVDWDSLKKVIKHLEANGTDCFVVNGTTAESPTLNHDEKVEIVKFVKEHTTKKIVVGTGSNNTAETIKFTNEIESLGVDGVMVVTPYYNKPSQLGIVEHFKAVCESTKLPVVVYNIPGRTGTNIEVETMIEIAKNENVVALKESSGNLSQAANMIRSLPESVSVYSGDDNLMLPILSVGGAGVISVASHLVGNEIQNLVSSFKNGKVKEAAELHLKLLPLFEGIFKFPNPIPTKYLLSKLDLCKEFVRLPLLELSSDQKKIIDNI